MHRLLIAEDVPVIAGYIENLARDAGIEVVAIIDSIEGARAAASLSPDVAIIDLNLSDGFTGPMVAHELNHIRDTRVIYLTANPELLPDTIHAHHRVLRKPLIAREVVDALLGTAIEVTA